MKELISKIKEKKELSGLADEFVLSILNEYISKKKIKLDKLTPSSTKILVKEIRSKLRLYSGRFQHKSKKGKELSKEELLKSHLSTKERLDFYPRLIEIISSIKPNSILDLGCGLNPLALASRDVIYYATDIKGDELDLINNYFKKNKIKGKAFYTDLRDPEKLPTCDLTLIFKVLDILDTKGHKNATKLLSLIKSDNIFVSFPTKTISGKKMNVPRRQWFEKYILENGYNFDFVKTNNEIFYLLSK